jgi:hypothetical protein
MQTAATLFYGTMWDGSQQQRPDSARHGPEPVDCPGRIANASANQTNP